jgi:hypothetical protein
MIKLVALITLLVTTNNLFGQAFLGINLKDKIFSVCKDNADNFLKKRVDSLFDGASDSLQKARKIAKLEYYNAQLLMIERNLKLLLAQNAIATNNFIKLAFDEFRKNMPDLPEAFYDKSLLDINKL